MSAVFFDLGITDAITDKHRYYPASYILPVAGSPVIASAQPVDLGEKERFGAQVQEVADSMMCTAGARMTESTAESEKWELDCGDGESLRVRCFDDACYVK